ncbi:maleylpyruvate isomerase family mycothiol-dependent enzyme [Actinomadura sp. KC345]|uniref:maleylpyruvate isomerase family mycothiol-dependent enzyme n=1 Tax=Actinomadura sp. KC345 TaxID=2530371 RepID=UPI00105163BD|nr:maleylpyruvate isomerase family mycothiol-dependent enzyme [Actinomadura sp. KC345]TDC39330.1 maleylpyruvate isomerase family mycothiol-dependent enzyme [Actinomadura sp. KC345]
MNEPMRATTAAYEQTVRSTVALAAEFGDADWERPTECPGWTVKDQLSHLVGVELGLLGDPPPDIDVPEFDHIRTEFGRSLEAAVHVRRPVPGPAVAAELADVLERRLAQLPGIDPDRAVTLPDGNGGTYAHLMKFRAMDCWTHEQDVRRAVGRPGNLDAPAAHCFWELLSKGLPIIAARRAKAEPGQIVAFTISDPLDFHVAVRVGDDGRGHWTAPDAPTAELAMDWETYVRLTTGRCTPDAVTVHTTGDRDLASRTLAAMNIMI